MKKDNIIKFPNTERSTSQQAYPNSWKMTVSTYNDVAKQVHTNNWVC